MIHSVIKGEIAQTPKGLLYFKTACSLLDEETILLTDKMAQSPIFKGFKNIVLPEGEEAAVNDFRINDSALVSAHFAKTIELLDRQGFSVRALKTSEIEKIDAGLACMSHRWLNRE